MIERLRLWTARHQSFLLILLLFVSFRLFAVWLMRPGGFITDASDYDFYAEWGSLAARGYRTFDNLWTAYPPLFPALMLPIYELSSRIPPWVEPRLAFHVLFGAFLLLFEAANLVLIYRLAGKLEREKNAVPKVISPVIFYALLFAPVHTLLGWFEAMPLFFLLLGLDLLLGRARFGWIASAVAVALGFLVKLTPIVLVPVAVAWLGAKLSWQAARREWFTPTSPGNLLRPAIYVAVCLGVIVGLGYLLVGGKLDLAFSSFRINSLRPPWQSVWALWDGFYGYGLVPLDMRNLEGLNKMLWESRVPWGAIGAVFALLYLWLYTRRYDWARPRAAVVFTGVSVILLFLYSKGWSPQFLVWILAFVVLLLPNARGVFVALALSALNFIESYIYLIVLPDERWIMAGTVLLRTFLLVLLMAEFLGQIWPSATGRSRRAIARLTWVGVAALALFVLLGSPRMAQGYGERRLAEHPCRAAIEFLRSEAGGPNDILATTQPEVQRELYPWLRNDYTLRVIDGYNPQDRPFDQVEAERLVTFTGKREFWWAQMEGDALTPAAYFSDPAVHVLEERTLGSCRLARVLRSDVATPLAIFQVAGGPIRLLRAEMSPARMGEPLDLVLYWQADEAVQESYTVFTQVVDANGRIVAQQDNPPGQGAAPTDVWQPGAIVRDAYRLDLPEGVALDQLKLLVGLYTADGRAPATLPDGASVDAVGMSWGDAR
jgi:hypothetical protein